MILLILAYLLELQKDVFRELHIFKHALQFAGETASTLLLQLG